MAEYPRVTAILAAAGLGPDLARIDPVTLEVARARGIAVHEAIEGDVYGFAVGIAPDHEPYYAAYRRFLVESKFKALACEFRVEHGEWRYQGHPDLLGWLGPGRAILDVKTGDATGGEYQVTAYVEAWNAQHPEQSVTTGAVLALHRDGTYRFREVDLSETRPVWLAAVTLWHARARQNGGPSQ